MSCSTRCPCIKWSCVAEGLREVYVTVQRDRLVTTEGGLSTPDLQAYFDRLDVRLEDGWRVEVNLRARDWMSEVARRLGRGFVILIDYGHEARELYSAAHASGTLTTFARHTMAGPETRGSRAAVAAASRRPGHHGARRLHDDHAARPKRPA